jgi:hypothetical protein
MSLTAGISTATSTVKGLLCWFLDSAPKAHAPKVSIRTGGSKDIFQLTCSASGRGFGKGMATPFLRREAMAVGTDVSRTTGIWERVVRRSSRRSRICLEREEDGRGARTEDNSEVIYERLSIREVLDFGFTLTGSWISVPNPCLTLAVPSVGLELKALEGIVSSFSSLSLAASSLPSSP